MVTFSIGDKEKHTIVFNYDTIWGKLTIAVDGIERVSTRKMIVGETPFQFQIGDKEKHDLRIVLKLPLFFALRGGSMVAFVDGKLVHEEHIGASLTIFFMIFFAIFLAFFILGLS